MTMNSLQKKWMASIEACSTQKQAPSYFTVVNQTTGLPVAITNSEKEAHFLASAARQGGDPHHVEEHLNWPVTSSPGEQSSQRQSRSPRASNTQQVKPRYAMSRNCSYLLYT